MSDATEETIPLLIDKIIGYADGRHLIINHLYALKTRCESLILRLEELETDTSYQKLAAELDSTSAQLHEERELNERLRSDAAKQKKSAAKAKQKQPKPTPDELDALEFIGARPGCDHSEVADALEIMEEEAMFLLEGLRSKNLAERRGFHPHRWEWHPTQPGRSYLAKKGLLA